MPIQDPQPSESRLNYFHSWLKRSSSTLLHGWSCCTIGLQGEHLIYAFYTVTPILAQKAFPTHEPCTWLCLFRKPPPTMIVHTSPPTHRQAVFIPSREQVKVVHSYVYPAVTRISMSGSFSMTQATKDRFTRGYVALSLLERQYHQAHFQEHHSKVWLFNIMVNPTLVYNASIWAPSLPMYMLSQMIHSKASTPHEIINHDSRSLIPNSEPHQPDSTMPPQRIASELFEASKQMAMKKHADCHGTHVMMWFNNNGISFENSFWYC